MTDIPDDVVKAARSALKSEGAISWTPKHMERLELAVALAILAERERWSAEIKRLTSESSLYMVGFEDGWEAAIGEPPENNS